MKNAPITAIIPAYNAEDSIIHSLNSIIEQTLLPEKIIVINDGSTDTTEIVVQNWISDHPQIPVELVYQTNAGVAAARNTGIIRTQTEYIAFLDSDDQWEPTKLEKQLAVFELYPDTALVSTLSTIQGDGNNSLEKLHFRKMLFKTKIVTSSVLIKTQVMQNYLFDSRLKRSEDFHTWLQICANHDAYLLHTKLVQFANKSHFGQAGLSKNMKAFEKAELYNFYLLMQKKYLNPLQWLAASLFSLIKYIRRIIQWRLRQHEH